MRAVVQRVRDCSVTVDRSITGAIGEGLLVYLGVEQEDSETDTSYMCDKIVNLRIFSDSDGKMNLSALDERAEILVVSQFTLCADVRKGRRPSYAKAAEPDLARALYERFISEVGRTGLTVAQGQFGAMMDVTYTNRGPVTILLDSKKRL